jgi:AcrR family transcriptional regulator
MTTARHYPKGAAKRQEILQTAFELFSRKGRDHTSFREIARETGLSQAGLLHYFSSKEELLAEVLRLRDTVNSGEYGERDTLASMAQTVAHNAEVPGLVRLFSQLAIESADPDHPARDFYVARHDRIRRELAEDIERAYAGTPVEDRPDPGMVATLVLAMVDGLQLQWLRFPEIDMVEHLRLFYRMILPGGVPSTTGETPSA